MGCDSLALDVVIVQNLGVPAGRKSKAYSSAKKGAAGGIHEKEEVEEEKVRKIRSTRRREE